MKNDILNELKKKQYGKEAFLKFYTIIEAWWWGSVLKILIKARPGR